VFSAIDQGISHQQYPDCRKLSIIVVYSRTSQIEDLLPLVDQISKALATIQPGQTTIVRVPD